MKTHDSVTRERVTVTLRPELLAWADRKAKERGVSRSELIDGLLADAERREIAELMAEGYRAMGEENRALAEEGLESFCEATGPDHAWEDAPERAHAAG